MSFWEADFIWGKVREPDLRIHSQKYNPQSLLQMGTTDPADRLR